MNITLKPAFQLTFDELMSYDSLPDNMPDTKLTAKQIYLVDELYYKYISKNIDMQDWSVEMYKFEMRDKWPSGSKMKSVQAKRLILNNLVQINCRKELTDYEAAQWFHGALTCRPMYAKLLNKVYQIAL